MDSPGSCPLRGGPLELGLVSVSKLQVRLVRVVRFTMLESLGVCLIYGFMSTRKLRLSSQAQIETPLYLLVLGFYCTAVYKNLLDSCLRILRCLQFESATLRGPLVSDASQLLPLIWHYAYRPKPNRFWQLLLVYRHIHHRTRRPRVHPYIAKKDSAHRCRVGKASPSPVHPPR